METTPKLFQYLGIGIHTNFEDNRLKYKHIFVDESPRYIHELEQMFDDFRIEYQRDIKEVDSFDLLAQITDIIDNLTIYFYNEVEFSKPYITELPERAEEERREKKRYRDNQLHLLEPTIEREIKLAKKVKKFIVKHRSTVPASAHKQILPLQERVNFEGKQTTLVALFFTLQLISKLTFNKKSMYSTEQKHLEDFLEKNFAYKNGLKYEDVKNVEKALSDLRQQYEKTADVAKKNVLTMIDDCITFLSAFKEQLEVTEMRPEEKDFKKQK